MNHQLITPEEIVYLYLSKQKDPNVSVGSLARSKNITRNTLYNYISLINRSLAGQQVKLSSNLQEAITIIKRSKSVKSVPVTPVVAEDHFTAFKQATEAYQEGITTFIEKEVARRVESVQKENEALKRTIEHLNKENDAYQKAFLEAKNSNWVDALRKKWGNP